MASIQPPIDNGAVAADPTSLAAEQLAAAEAAETKGDDTDTASAETQAVPEATAVDVKDKGSEEMRAKWPGWPGYSVFRLVVPVLKVGGIIGRKGDLIKKLVEETRARVRVLDGPLNSPDRIVLISGKEDPEAALPPAMDAIIRIFKRVNGLPENDGEGKGIGAAGTAFCLIRLLVASTQAISLIGKQGSLIKSIQESTGASVRVLSNDELPVYASSEERIVELQGEAQKVLKALEAVVGHLRKFLVDHSVLPLFEKSYNAPATQERQVDAWSEKTLLHANPQTSLGADYSVSMKRDSHFFDRDSQMESRIASSRLSLYGPEHGLGSRSSTIGHSGGPVVTQIAQTMQIPLAYAEDIIGVQGTNIDYIRRTSGAILTVQESRGLPEEITVEIKGTSSQVQAAQQLIQEFIGGHREPHQRSYGKLESSLRPSYSQLGSSSYSSSSFAEQPYGGYGSSGVGGYSSFRL
ncbi:RNA-binding KH domain-containing protein PEPPER [Sesamum alatum]|uniref:RNA-binding KH domain-containing protein PEPPER n=1 Tax=Sesamum alatum TaxID=300844 RepID=A0AAE1YLZ3_9LAMI|nr:RNA-binding KH domain-containing protein PEPPER [Sesamum alatum]